MSATLRPTHGTRLGKWDVERGEYLWVREILDWYVQYEGAIPERSW